MNKYILVYNMSWFWIPLKSMFHDTSVHCTAWLTNMQAQSNTNEYLPEGEFLATLVALHFTPVSKWVSGQSFGLA